MRSDLTDVDVDLFGSMVVFMQLLASEVEERLRPFELTTRQWLLLGVIDKAFPGAAPTLSEAAAAFGTSRQNVKQVALQLERRGWLELRRDPQDRRATRLVLTERVAVFDEPGVQADQSAFILSVFGGLTRGERQSLLAMVQTCIARLSPPSEVTDRGDNWERDREDDRRGGSS